MPDTENIHGRYSKTTRDWSHDYIIWPDMFVENNEKTIVPNTAKNIGKQNVYSITKMHTDLNILVTK